MFQRCDDLLLFSFRVESRKKRSLSLYRFERGKIVFYINLSNFWETFHFKFENNNSSTSTICLYPPFVQLSEYDKDVIMVIKGGIISAHKRDIISRPVYIHLIPNTEISSPEEYFRLIPRLSLSRSMAPPRIKSPSLHIHRTNWPTISQTVNWIELISKKLWDIKQHFIIIL